MSDVREVNGHHEAMEGTLRVAAERLEDAFDELAKATGIPATLAKLLDAIATHPRAIRTLREH